MNKQPKYIEIMNFIRHEIKINHFMPNTRIPSERDLTTLLQASRMTVRFAINELTNEGLLYKIQGSGTYVTGLKIQKPLVPLTSFTEDMRLEGKEVSTILVSFERIEANSVVAEKLNIKEGEAIFRIARLRVSKDLILLYEVIYQPVAILPLLSEQSCLGSIYKYIEEQGLIISYSNVSIEAMISDIELAQILKISEGEPLLLMKDVTHLGNGNVLHYVKSFYIAKYFYFSSTISRNNINR